MVRPRSEQIDHLVTHHSKFTYGPSVGSFEEGFVPATLHANTVTDVNGGVERQTTATVITDGPLPFSINAGDAFSIAIDSAAPVTITLSATDNTPSAIGAAVDAALGGSFTSVDNIYLSIFSNTPGATGSITIADVVSGTLAKLGLTAGTYTGFDPPVRGIVTLSPDNKGGYVSLKTIDQKDILSDSGATICINDSFGLVVRISERPGGIPLFGRLTHDGSSYVMKYRGRVPTRPRIQPYNPSFASLDGTDTLDITVTDPAGTLSATATVTFPSGPGLTSTQVADRINEVWANLVTTSGSGQAFIVGSISGPFTFEAGFNVLTIKVNGAGSQTVSFTAGTLSAIQVASEFNAAISNATAVVISSGDSEFIRIESDSSTGRTSSLEFLLPTGGQTRVYDVLGISPGVYRGLFLAETIGVHNFILNGIGRGSQAEITIASANPTTLTRIGLNAGTYIGDDEGEEDYPFPEMFVNDDTTVEPIVAYIPEVMDFGEVPTYIDTHLHDLSRAGSSDNLIQFLKNTYTEGIRRSGRGLLDAGKSVTIGPDGKVYLSPFISIRAEYENLFKKFVKGDFAARSVTALVTASIETPGTSGNPGSKSPSLIIDVDPDDSNSSRFFQTRFGRDGATAVPFSVEETSITGLGWLIRANDTAGSPAALANLNSAMRFYDLNTGNVGTSTGGLGYIPLSSGASNEGDASLRIMESQEATNEPISIFRQVNARPTVTCGDGINSWGDFNGSDAIQQALVFFNANIASNGLHLYLKPGTYIVDATNGTINIPSGSKITLEGDNQESVEIRNNDATATTISVAASSTFTIKNLLIDDPTTPGSNAVSVGSDSSIILEDVIVSRSRLYFTDSKSCHALRCTFTPGNNGIACMQFLMSDGNGPNSHKDFFFKDCEFVSGNDNPITRIVADGAIPITRIKHLNFVRCNVSLGTTTISAGNLTGNCGILDLDSNGSDVNSFSPGSPNTGVILDKITYRDCNVKANVNGGAISILMHCIPQPNGVSYAAGGEFMGITRMEILGGTWLAPALDTTINPFTVLEIGTVTDSATKADEDGALIIRDCVMGFAGSEGTPGINQGGATSDIDGTLFRGAGDTAPSVDNWGAWAVSGKNVTINNVRFTGFSQLPGTGPLAVKWDNFVMRNCQFDRYKLGGPGSSTHMVLLRPRSTTNPSEGALLENIIFKGRNATSGTWGNAIIRIDPNSGTGAVESETYPITIDRMKVRGFQLAGSSTTQELVRANGFASPGSLYNGSFGSYKNVTITNCDIDNISSLLHYSTPSATITQHFTNIRINSNIARNGINPGIDLLGGTDQTLPTFDYVEIKNNIIYGYTNQGIVVAQDVWVGTGTLEGRVNITGNRVYHNNGGPTNVQIQLSAKVFQSAANQRVLGVVSDNDCSADNSAAASPGKIKINATDGAGGVDHLSGGTNPANFETTGAPLRGVITGWDYAGTTTDLRFVSDAVAMLRNVAILESP